MNWVKSSAEFHRRIVYSTILISGINAQRNNQICKYREHNWNIMQGPKIFVSLGVATIPPLASSRSFAQVVMNIRSSVVTFNPIRPKVANWSAAITWFRWRASSWAFGDRGYCNLNARPKANSFTTQSTNRCSNWLDYLPQTPFEKCVALQMKIERERAFFSTFSRSFVESVGNLRSNTWKRAVVRPPRW